MSTSELDDLIRDLALNYDNPDPRAVYIFNQAKSKLLTLKKKWQLEILNDYEQIDAAFKTYRGSKNFGEFALDWLSGPKATVTSKSNPNGYVTEIEATLDTAQGRGDQDNA